MAPLGTGALAIVGAVVLLLLVGGAVMLFLGCTPGGRRRRRGGSWHGCRRRCAGPALAMLVRADGRIEMAPSLAGWLGLDEPPRTLADLAADNGLSAEETAAVERDVGAAQRAARPFERAVTPRGSGRTLAMRGSRAPAELGNGVLVWVSDASDARPRSRRWVARRHGSPSPTTR